MPSKELLCITPRDGDRSSCAYRFRLEHDRVRECHRIFACGLDLPLVHDFAANKVRVSRAVVLQPVHEQLALWRFVPMTHGEFLISNVDGLQNDLLSGYGHIKCKHTDDIEDKTVRWRFRRCHDFTRRTVLYLRKYLVCLKFWITRQLELHGSKVSFL